MMEDTLLKFKEQHLNNYRLAILETIKNTPNVYTILNGDLCNTALKNSKSDVYSDELSPMEQINRLIELLESIKDKILVIGTGNHEDRIMKDTSIDVIRLVARQLGIEDRYADNWWYLFLRFGEKEHGRKAPMCYQITGYHGSGGGRKTALCKRKLALQTAAFYAMIRTKLPPERSV